MSFTYALRIYFGIWPAVTLNFGQTRLSRADSCQGRMSVSAFRGLKVTEHEVTGDDALKVIICMTGRPLTFPIWRSIPLTWNLSVTANVHCNQFLVKTFRLMDSEWNYC